MGILGVDRVIIDGDNKKVLGVRGSGSPRYLPEVQGIREFRVFRTRLRVYSQSHFGLLWGEHRWRHLYA